MNERCFSDSTIKQVIRNQGLRPVLAAFQRKANRERVVSYPLLMVFLCHLFYGCFRTSKHQHLTISGDHAYVENQKLKLERFLHRGGRRALTNNRKRLLGKNYGKSKLSNATSEHGIKCYCSRSWSVQELRVQIITNQSSQPQAKTVGQTADLPDIWGLFPFHCYQRQKTPAAIPSLQGILMENLRRDSRQELTSSLICLMYQLKIAIVRKLFCLLLSPKGSNITSPLFCQPIEHSASTDDPNRGCSLLDILWNVSLPAELRPLISTMPPLPPPSCVKRKSSRDGQAASLPRRAIQNTGRADEGRSGWQSCQEATHGHKPTKLVICWKTLRINSLRALWQNHFTEIL